MKSICLKYSVFSSDILPIITIKSKNVKKWRPNIRKIQNPPPLINFLFLFSPYIGYSSSLCNASPHPLDSTLCLPPLWSSSFLSSSWVSQHPYATILISVPNVLFFTPGDLKFILFTCVSSQKRWEFKNSSTDEHWGINFTPFLGFHTGRISMHLLWYFAYYHTLPSLFSIFVQLTLPILQINYITSDFCCRSAQTKVPLITHLLPSPCSFESACMKKCGMYRDTFIVWTLSLVSYFLISPSPTNHFLFVSIRLILH